MSENVNANPYVDVFRKIGYCRANSDDVNFHKYLDLKLEEAENATVAPDALLYDVEVNYGRYLEYAKKLAAEKGENVSSGSNAADASNNVENNTADSVNVNMQNFVNSNMNQSPKSVAPKAPKKKSDIEYKIGAGVLSVIGAIFILVALINFGKYFLDDVFEGFMIYVAGTVVILASELIFNKRLPVFSRVLTGIGFGVLYFATIFCCSKLGLFPVWIALLILCATAILNIIFARIRKSQIIDIICTLGVASSIFVMGSTVSDNELFMIAGLILFVNVILFIKPYNKANTVSTMIRLTILFLVSITIRFLKNAVNADEIEILAYVLLAVFVIFICYIFNTSNMLIKSFALTYIGVLLSTCILAHDLGLNSYTYVWVGGVVSISVISFLAMITKKEKWSAYSVFVLSMLFTGIACNDKMVAILIILACALLSKFMFAVRSVQLTDAFVATIAMLSAVAYHDELLSYVLVAVIVIGTIMNTRFKLYHAFMLLFTGYMFTIAVAGDKFFFAPLILLICFVLMLLFNLIPTMRVKGILVFNIITLVIMAIVTIIYPFDTAFRKLIDVIFNNDYSRITNVLGTSMIMVVGVVTILSVFTKKFRMKTSAKYIILAVFLTYNAFTMDVDQIWRSVSVMAIAFLMIAVGCVVNKFSLRLYGLILSLLVCLKVAFYDFREGDDLTRMLVFLILGVLAIAISLTYLLLEKHERKEMKKMAEKAAAATNVANVQNTVNTVGESLVSQEVEISAQDTFQEINEVSNQEVVVPEQPEVIIMPESYDNVTSDDVNEHCSADENVGEENK